MLPLPSVPVEAEPVALAVLDPVAVTEADLPRANEFKARLEAEAAELEATEEDGVADEADEDEADDDDEGVYEDELDEGGGAT